jgi:alcohol dehydrogenase class IV
MLGHDLFTVSQLGFLAPRQVIARAGGSSDVGEALHAWGVASGPVLVVADRFVEQTGLLVPVLDGLGAAGYSAGVFAEIAGEPDADVVDRAADVGRDMGAVAVVGVGGGSALDTAKLVALLQRNPGSVAEWLGVVSPPEPVAPLVLVPTTTGTGSEATRISMVTVEGRKRVVSWAQFVPLLAVLDAELVAGLPGPVVASTGMDAVAHAVESMMSTTRTPFTVAVATQALALLSEDLEPAVLGGDEAARGRLLYAAHLSGLALNAGVVLGHSLAYAVANRSPMPHGTSCSLALPYCLLYNAGQLPEELAAHIARLVTSGRGATLADAAAELVALAERLGLPTRLDAVGIAADQAGEMAQEVVRDYPRPTNPTPLDAAALTDLLSHMVTGDLDGAHLARSGGTLV